MAQRYATRYPAHVRSLVLMGSGPPTREQTRQCVDAIVQRIIALTEQEIIAEHLEPDSPEVEKSYLAAYFSDPSFWFSADDRGSALLIDKRVDLVADLTWTANAGYDLTADLAGLSQRVLNLWGDDDPCRPISSPAILAALTHAEVKTAVLSRCGHFWHECPEQFFTAVRSFLELG